MKQLAIAFLLTWIGTNGFAQKADQVLARVSYTYTQKDDTLKNGKAISHNMLLFVGKNASLYTSFDKIRHEIAEDQKFRAMIANRAGSNKPVAFVTDANATNWMYRTSYFYFAQENRLFGKEFISLQSYLYEEKVPEIKWQITKDTTSFSGVHCQKATASFEGKNWTAWFAPSLPFRYGPWKLNGLPGLIIEAYDESKDTAYRFAGIADAKEGDFQRIDDIRKRPDSRPGDMNAIDQMIGIDVSGAYFENIIKLPTNAVKTTKKELDNLRAAFQKDPRGFVKAQSGF
ncbi:GLPGLI family protein [Pedobacter sp. KR3-3]|uniref:GLPGLI family protein n=1 Tax=Pedobacter albus TaxID=3113905 RepID=A0ABU7I3V9_9SPHI|nr:GLPGLI family protein [Pedobacter sp. KR3-3]MEE1943944.1 GLPGLI family protein [Pedobacter sp. KR3-3]